MKNSFLPYKSIGDAPYLLCPWFYSPFKGTSLSVEKAYWNFIQSGTRMVVERSFGMMEDFIKAHRHAASSCWRYCFSMHMPS